MTQPGAAASQCIEIAVAVVERAGQFLIGQRPQGVALAGYWEFPGGKIEPGESPAQAAKRECKEETGLAIRIVREHSVVEHRYDHGWLRLHFLLAACDASEASLPERFRWVHARQLTDYTFPPANAALVQALGAQSMP